MLKRLPRFLYLIYALLRIIIQTLQLLNLLLVKQRYDYILIQNPPCVPLLLVSVVTKFITKTLSCLSCGLCCKTKQGSKGSQLIVDWHNYGYTIMQVNHVNRHLVSIAKFYELFLGRFADYNLTVSQAMKEDLARIAPAIGRKPIHVLYDRATPKFKMITSLKEKYELFKKINLED